MPPEERRQRVLEFLDEHDMPLPPTAIFAGMYRQQKITFSYRTLQNILKDLLDDGAVVRVDPEKLRKGEFITIDEGSERRSGYYFLTESGRERIEDR